LDFEGTFPPRGGRGLRRPIVAGRRIGGEVGFLGLVLPEESGRLVPCRRDLLEGGGGGGISGTEIGVMVAGETPPGGCEEIGSRVWRKAEAGERAGHGMLGLSEQDGRVFGPGVLGVRSAFRRNVRRDVRIRACGSATTDMTAPSSPGSEGGRRLPVLRPVLWRNGGQESWKISG
jgi:hypothetical protein